jgi:dUTP pyrophosphatase
MEIPMGYVGLVFPRSSISKYDLRLANCVAVIDAGYRGPIKLRFKESLYHRLRRKVTSFFCHLTGHDFVDQRKYEVGDKIGQMIIMPIPAIEFELAETLSEAKRGDNGFGSTGK